MKGWIRSFFGTSILLFFSFGSGGYGLKLLASEGVASPPGTKGGSSSPGLTLSAAVELALQKNPELAAIRQQRGIAAAGVVIAKTYPHNPYLEGNVRGVSAPRGEQVGQPFIIDHKFWIPLELFRQGKYRRQAAQANLSRTEWEIAHQETLLAVRTSRAFHAVLYRHGKLKLLEDSLKRTEQAAAQVKKLREAGKVSTTDLIQIRAEIVEAKAQLNPGRQAVTSGWDDLRRQLGHIDDKYHLHGSLEEGEDTFDVKLLTAFALEKRADLKARQLTLGEAEAKLRLERANRWGNPVIAPAHEVDESRTHFIGGQYSIPFPIFNRKKGEILQREAEIAKAVFEIRQSGTQVQQEVQAAFNRLQEATAWAKEYRAEVFPAYQANLKEIEKLQKAGEGGVDSLKVLDFQRRLLRAHEGYLDALFEFQQARADLAAAVGEPALLLSPAKAP